MVHRGPAHSSTTQTYCIRMRRLLDRSFVNRLNNGDAEARSSMAETQLLSCRRLRCAICNKTKASDRLRHGCLLDNLTLGSECRQTFHRRGVWNFCLARSEVFYESIIVVFIIVIRHFGQLFEVQLVSKQGTNATKSFNKLIAFAGSIRYKFQVGTKIFVSFGKPFEE